jgi:hypothetical protein
MAPANLALGACNILFGVVLWCRTLYGLACVPSSAAGVPKERGGWRALGAPLRGRRRRGLPVRFLLRRRGVTPLYFFNRTTLSSTFLLAAALAAGFAGDARRTGDCHQRQF